MQSMTGLLAAVDDALLGPLAALALALLIIGLFLKGSLLSKVTVPREDYEAQRDISAAYAEGLKLLTTAVNALAAIQKNGGAR